VYHIMQDYVEVITADVTTACLKYTAVEKT
jgi:hypothetical protein